MNHKKPPIPMDSLLLTRKRMTSYRKLTSDTIPLTLSNLSSFLDWKSTLPQSPTLYKIATIIWLYLPPSPVQQYSVNFQHSKENTIIQTQPISPPVLVTSSPKGDLLIMVQSLKKTDTIFLLILYPSYISNCTYFDTSTIKLDIGLHCIHWEITNIHQLTHLAMDKHGYIYFTDSKAIYTISKTHDIHDHHDHTISTYSHNYQNLYIPQHNTSHITSLWRQSNAIYFSLQNHNEEYITVYRLRRHPAQNSASNSSTSGSDMENESNTEFFKKIKTFKFSLKHNEKIQLGYLRYKKKHLLAISAAVKGNKPTILQFGHGLDAEINVYDIMNCETVLWPKSLPNEIPHAIYYHKDSKSWFCIAPVLNEEIKESEKFYWMQFQFDKERKNIIWRRLIEIPDEKHEGEWLYYDETRDVLVGYKGMDVNKNEYIFKYLPDISKYLCVSDSVPIMHRIQNKPKKHGNKNNESSKLNKSNSKKNIEKFSLKKKRKKKKDVDNTSNIKPSLARKNSPKKVMEKVGEDDVMD